MAKQLKANDISNLYAKEYSYKKIIVTTSDNQEYEVQIQQKLNDTSIMELVASLTERSEYCKKNNIEFNPIMNTYFLLIKYFTNIKFKVYETLDKQYAYEIIKAKELVDLGFFNQIVSHFDKETMDKIQKAFETYTKQTNIVTNNIMLETLKKQANVEVISDEEKF